MRTRVPQGACPWISLDLPWHNPVVLGVEGDSWRRFSWTEPTPLPALWSEYSWGVGSAASWRSTSRCHLLQGSCCGGSGGWYLDLHLPWGTHSWTQPRGPPWEPNQPSQCFPFHEEPEAGKSGCIARALPQPPWSLEVEEGLAERVGLGLFFSLLLGLRLLLLPISPSGLKVSKEIGIQQDGLMGRRRWTQFQGESGGGSHLRRNSFLHHSSKDMPSSHALGKWDKDCLPSLCMGDWQHSVELEPSKTGEGPQLCQLCHMTLFWEVNAEWVGLS